MASGVQRAGEGAVAQRDEGGEGETKGQNADGTSKGQLAIRLVPDTPRRFPYQALTQRHVPGWLGTLIQ